MTERLLNGRLADNVGAGLVPVLDAVAASTASQVFSAAIALDVFGAVGDGPTGTAEIQRRLGLHPRPLPDFLDALTAMGLLVRGADGYRATAAARRHLSARGPEFIGQFVAAGTADELVHLLRTGQPPEPSGGEEAGGDPYADPAFAGPFIAFMDSMNAMIADELLEAVDWSAHSSFVDVDGSRGELASRLVAAHPSLTGVVVDRAEVAPAFEERFASDPGRDRVSFRAADGGPLPEGDVVLVGGVLHDIAQKERADLLGRVYEAVRPGGLALVYDVMIDDDRTALNPLLGSLQMMMTVPDGGKYTPSQCRSWVEAAGFTGLTTQPMGVDTLIVAHKA
ncbi:methyltransferase [Streptomyces albus subsp. chlorinus]|uniref:methyltransferase n=1 Tax=Streptomyces albus TaxID=1888 RepID=UPI00157036FE|nr:methyltransferase [Streptomyces albus]NSC21546.1 methyltransferase [Streptomyces albus subsp. chlorinus]